MTNDRLNRRAFLKASLGLVTGTLATSVPLAGCRPPQYPQPPQALEFFTPKEWAVLRAASARLVPSGPGRLGAPEVDVATAADRLFAKANARLKSELKQLLNAFEDFTVLAFRFKPFTAMNAAEQDDYLRAWMDSGLGMQRQGFLALNKISGMLFYMDPRSWPQIGYPGPWIGRYDFGQGLDQQGDMARPVNPNVFARFPA